jgi:chondroitin AC lyase
MDLARGKLRARKAWFFFDDGYLALGAGITCDSDNPVATSVNQCRLSGGADSDVARRDDWLHHGGVGYVFADAPRVKLTTGLQTGDWADIGAQSGRVAERVFNLWLDHGPRPNDASYVYSVYPAATAEHTAQRAAKPEFVVIANTSKQQAVFHERLNTLAVAFWEPGAVDFADGRKVEVDRPCALIIRVGKCFISNPANEAAVVNVRLDGKNFPVELPGGDRAGSSVEVKP